METAPKNKLLYSSRWMLHSNRIYPKLFIILFSNSWWLLSAAFFWNTMLVVILCKILHRDFTTAIYENFTSVFLFIQGKRKVESWKVAFLFYLINWTSQSSFEVRLLNSVLENENCPKNTKYHVRWKLQYKSI